MKSSTVLLFVVVIASCLQFNESQKFNIKKWFRSNRSDAASRMKYYDEINAYLTKNLPNAESMEENLELVEHWHTQLGEKTGLSRPSRRLVESVEQFLELKKLYHDQLCSPSSGKILEANIASTGNSVAQLKRRGLEGARRIDKIIYQLAESHSRQCPRLLVKPFHEKYDQLPAASRDRIESMREQLESLHLAGNDLAHLKNLKRLRDKPERFYEENHELFMKTGRRQIHDLRVVYEILDSESIETGDSDNLHLHQPTRDDQANRDGLFRMYYRYLVKPCSDFTTGLEPVLSPLQFDLAYNEPAEYETVPESSMMLRTLATYQACENLIKRSEFLYRYLPNYVDWHQRADRPDHEDEFTK